MGEAAQELKENIIYFFLISKAMKNVIDFWQKSKEHLSFVFISIAMWIFNVSINMLFFYTNNYYLFQCKNKSFICLFIL